MTYAKTTRPFSDRSADDKVAALFSHEPLASIDSQLLAHDVPSGGRTPEYPPLMQLLIVAATRLFGSQRNALIELRAGSRWQECCRRYANLVGAAMPLPSAPPTPKQQDDFVKRLCVAPGVLEAIAEELFEVAWGQAVLQGQFPNDGAVPDFANPDLRRLVFGDGVYIKPNSDVTTLLDPDTGELVPIGSRSELGKPRIQRTLTDPTLDGKHAVGVNNVIIGTWTPAGRVILMNKQVLPGDGNEATVARKMLEALATRARGRVHTVVWDRIVQGQQIQDTMAIHRMLLLTTPRSRDPRSRTTDGYTALILNDEQATRLHETGAPLLLGTTVWPTAKGLEVIRSAYYRMPLPSHVATCPHAHDFWVDGGALFDAEATRSGHLVKVAAATARRSVPSNPSFDDWELHTEWAMPCPVAGEHRFTTRARPGADQDPVHRAVRELRPLAAANKAFWKVHGFRNNTESHNSWYQAQLGADSRAQRLDVRAQFLDQLGTAMAVNALTWLTHRRQQSLGAFTGDVF